MLFTKIFQNSQENIGAGLTLFLSTASNFTTIETPAQVFSC